MFTAELSHDQEAQVTSVSLAGGVVSADNVELRALILQCVAGCPRAVVVDLAAVADPRGELLPVLLILQRLARQEQSVPVLWCAATGRVAERLGRERWRHVLSVFDARTQALLAAQRPPESRYRVHTDLPHDLTAPTTARAVVGDACFGWDLFDLAYPARVVASELVHNAVVHAAPPVGLTAVLGRSFLHLCVCDGSPKPPCRQPVTAPDKALPLCTLGAGLTLVDEHCAAWGVVPLPDGKQVWARLRR